MPLYDREIDGMAGEPTAEPPWTFYYEDYPSKWHCWFAWLMEYGHKLLKVTWPAFVYALAISMAFGLLPWFGLSSLALIAVAPVTVMQLERSGMHW